MGAHKYNPVAIAAKEGKIPPKKKPDTLSQAETNALLKKAISKYTGLDLIYSTMGGKYNVYD